MAHPASKEAVTKVTVGLGRNRPTGEVNARLQTASFEGQARSGQSILLLKGPNSVAMPPVEDPVRRYFALGEKPKALQRSRQRGLVRLSTSKKPRSRFRC